ncbi:MAG: M20/M25/M40 family metallo-hydrolase, partial [Gaiellaceae bacterium]
AERKLARIDDLHVDLCARDGDEARSFFAPGDAAVLEAEPIELREGRLVSRSLDNRLGCYIVLEAARRVAETGPPGDVIALAATQEEIGSHGARTAVFELRPAVALVFDVTGATDEPGADARADGAHALGSGPALLRGPVAHPGVLSLLEECAAAEGIACTSEVVGGPSMSDADVTHISRAGIASGLVSIPLRYMHTGIELCDLADVEACIRLAVAFAQRLGPETTFAR